MSRIPACALVCAATLLACRRPKPLEVTITPEWHGQPITCGAVANDPAFRLEDLRFFVHDLRLVDASGRQVPALPVPDQQWQTTQVALVDLPADCPPSRSGHAALHLAAEAGEYRELRFKLGVPFELNHANPAVAEGPLAIGAMNWGWNAGYKFLLLEGRLGDKPFRVHLGSTQCQGTFGHITGCGRSNRAEISVPLKGNGVVLELSELVDTAVLAAPKGCQGDAEPGCARPFAALGLDLASGKARGEQHAFHAR